MEALTSTFVGGRVAICTDQSASLQLGRGEKASKVAGMRCSASLGEEAVLVGSEKAREEQNAVIDILRGGLGRSKSSWWAPLFNLPSETSSLCSHRSGKKTAHSSSVTSLLRKQPNPGQTSGNGHVLSKDEDQLTMSRNVIGLPQQEMISTQGSPSSDMGKKGEPKHRRSAKFTAEKARMLRQELRASETWHDLMYHSAIASRLATPDN